MSNDSKQTKIAAFAGISEETAAQIRLMLRMVESRLTDAWRIGNEQEADFMLVETGNLEGDAALARFRNEGRAYGLLCDRDAAVAHGLVLWTPIKQEQLVALFNAASTVFSEAPDVAQFDENFYDAEMEKNIPVGAVRNVDEMWTAPSPKVAEQKGFGPPELEGLDRLIKGDPTKEEAKLPEIRLDDSVTLVDMEPTESIRAAQRGNEAATHLSSLDAIGKSPLDLIPPDSNEPLPATLLSKLAQKNTGTTSLAQLIADGALLRPTRLSYGTHPVLVLDPKPRLYYSAAPLEELSVYATEQLPTENVDAIVGNELQHVRDASGEGRSYDELAWLVALHASTGSLDRKLDPGGSYRLTKSLGGAPKLRSHGAIAEALRESRPLHEIAKISGASMTDVFDVVNAYAAIGYLEITPRQRLQSDEGSAISKLSRLFGKK